MKSLFRRPSPSMAVAMLALLVALGGTSYAAVQITGKNVKNSSLTGADIKNSSLTTSDVKNNSLLAADFKKGQAPKGAQGPAGAAGPTGVAGAAGATGAQGPAGPGTKAIARQRVIATSGPNVASARSAAPKIELYTKGALTVYGKCFTDTTAVTTHYGVYIETSQNGVVFDSRDDDKFGGPLITDFLNTDTPETLRELETENVAANNADMGSEDDSDFTAFAPDGTTLRGWSGAAVKNGTLAAGNGVYGEGNVCLFTGVVFSD